MSRQPQDLTIKEFGNTQSLDKQLTKDVAEKLNEAIEKRGNAVLVVSGGSTPKGYFNFLSAENLQWDKITVSIADERWLDKSHPDSNERLVRENLLQGKAAAAKFISLKTDLEDAVQAEESVGQTLKDLGTIDVLVLGMGTDGHTASLFPGSEGLEDAIANPDRACKAILPLNAPYQRMTMSLPRLLDSHHRIIHITGEKKKQVLLEAVKAGQLQELPISWIVAQADIPAIVYYCD